MHNGIVGWFSRRKKQIDVARQAKQVPEAAMRHLEDFLRTRRGVEAWVERPTNFNQATLLLVAASGESTRRAVPSVDYGYDFARRHNIPCYDAGVVPYPNRMREYGRQLRAQKD